MTSTSDFNPATFSEALSRELVGAALLGFLLGEVGKRRPGVGTEQIALDEAILAELGAFVGPAAGDNAPRVVLSCLLSLSQPSAGPDRPGIWTLKLRGSTARDSSVDVSTWPALRGRVDALQWSPVLSRLLASAPDRIALEDALVESLFAEASSEAVDVALRLAVIFQSLREQSRTTSGNAPDRVEKSLRENLDSLVSSEAELSIACPDIYLFGLATFASVLLRAKRVRLLTNSTPGAGLGGLIRAYQSPEAISQALRSLRHPNAAARRAAVSQAADSVRESLELLPQSDEVQRGLQRIHVAVQSGTFESGIAHIDASPVPLYLLHSGAESVAVVGAGNITHDGFGTSISSGVTLAAEHSVRECDSRFEQEWKRSVSFTEPFGSEMAKSWAVATPTPYEIYLKALFELSDAGEEVADDRASTPWEAEIFQKLADFQRVAVEQVVRIINRYGGAFLADVVGLGKSFMGAAVLRYYVDRDKVRPLILCPAGLTGMWERYSEYYGLNALVLSTGLLRRSEDGEPSILMDESRVRDRNFVLVDESHHFRNVGTQRYDVLREFLGAEERRCLMLTATPQSRGPRDIHNQLRLFHPADETLLPIATGSLSAFVRAVEKGKADVRDLLQHILVRRTRTHVQRWYGYDAVTGERIAPSEFEAAVADGRRLAVRVGGKLQAFPKRELRTLRYSIEDVYAGFYDRIQSCLGTTDAGAATSDSVLTYARYRLAAYLREDLGQDPAYEKLRRASASLSGILRILLFKRLESSVEAFRTTVERLARAHRRILSVLDSGWIVFGEASADLLNRDADSEDASSQEQEILSTLSELPDRYPVSDFEEQKLRADLVQDLRILEQISVLIAPITPANDPKLQSLLALVRSSELQGQKLLVFTEFVDTARYLFQSLKEEVADGELDIAHSSTSDKRRIVGRFSPRANPEFRYRAEEAETRILVTTDVISEGLNLQDCARVVNYDLHWNPVRLIQRFGRVDRIGTEHDTVRAYNFLPETGLERHLGLESVLASRIRDIHASVGEDSAILHEDEEINPEALRVIYGEDASGLQGLEQEDAPGFGVLEAQAVIDAVRLNDPELLERIASLPDGLRSARAGSGRQIFAICRAGDYRRVYLADPNGSVISTDIGEAIGAISCDREEPRLELPASYNLALSALLETFRIEAGERAARLAAAQRRSDAQSWVLGQLREIADSATDMLQRQRAVDFMELFGAPLSQSAVADLRKLRRARVAGAPLLDELGALYRRRRSALYPAHTAALTSADTARFVCTEAVVAG